MRILKIMTFFLLLWSYNVLVAQGFSSGYQALDLMLKNEDPGYETRKALLEQSVRDSAIAHRTEEMLANAGDVVMVDVLIPVVFHGIGVNITTNVAQLLITELNKLFKNGHNVGTGIGVNTQIQFCMASKDPNGNPTEGITLHTGQAATGPFCLTDDATIKSFASWNPDRYLNIWVCDLQGCPDVNRSLSWGTMPAMYYSVQSNPNKFRDGVVCSSSLLNNVSNVAKTLTHEIGHWLNLFNTFGDPNSTCGTPENDDGCSDTPWCVGANNAGATGQGCFPKTIQCTSFVANNPVRQIENFMDDSDNSCKDRFTLGQKTRMQSCASSLNEIRPYINDKAHAITACTDPCRNEVKDNGEAGVDCGGPCKPCPPKCEKTVQFKIEGQSVQTSRFINVCNGNITLSAFPYGKNCTEPFFRTNRVQRCTSPKQEHWNTCTFRDFRQCWECDYEILFISILECDAYKNPIGTEFMGWVNMPQTLSAGTYISAFNLCDYLLPIGATLTDGHMYRVRIASGSPWQSCDGFFKVFKSNLNLTNQTVPIDHYADNLNYSSCIINNNKSVAQFEITVTGESKIQNGHLYIGNYSCSQLPSFRMAGSSSEVLPINDAIKQKAYVNDATLYNSSHEKLNKKLTLKAVPNPTDGVVKISLQNAISPAESLELSNLSGIILYYNQSITEKEIELNLNTFDPGVYLVKVRYKGVVYSAKVIKQ